MSETPELDAELAALNQAVEAAITARREWMDAHMADYAKFKVGDEIYDRESGKKLGMVTELYRFWQDREPYYDTSMGVEYRYKTGDLGGMHVDNTSRHGSYTNWKFATLEEVLKHKTQELERLRLGMDLP